MVLRVRRPPYALLRKVRKMIAERVKFLRLAQNVATETFSRRLAPFVVLSELLRLQPFASRRVVGPNQSAVVIRIENAHDLARFAVFNRLRPIVTTLKVEKTFALFCGVAASF